MIFSIAAKMNWAYFTGTILRRLFSRIFRPLEEKEKEKNRKVYKKEKYIATETLSNKFFRQLEGKKKKKR